MKKIKKRFRKGNITLNCTFIIEIAFALDLDAGGNVNRAVRETVSPSLEIKRHISHAANGKIISLATTHVSCVGLKPDNTRK